MIRALIKDISNIYIPVPCPCSPKESLKVQSYIVSLLEIFYKFDETLKSELTARKKQYSYYLRNLLTFDRDSVKWFKISELVKVVVPPEKVNKSMYKETGTIPVIDQSTTFISGYTDSNTKTLPVNEYILFGEHSETIKFVDFVFAQGSYGLKILKPLREMPKYIYYAFQNFYDKKKCYKRHWSSARETKIPIPYPENPKKSILEQGKIIQILDTLHNLAYSDKIGLPAEINLRKKQYNFYLNEIFNFTTN